MESFEKPKYQGIIIVAEPTCLADYTIYGSRQRRQFESAIEAEKLSGFVIVNSKWMDKPLSLLNIEEVANRLCLEYARKIERK